MAERKALSRKTRFEVFKRDKFTCQYCGAKAPDAILEVDHIKPVAKGGKNDIINLITACRSCNSGKGARELSDDAVITKQRKQLEDIQSRREMIEMIAQWRTELIEQQGKEVDIICETFESPFNVEITSRGRAKIRSLIQQYGFDEVVTASDIAVNKYETANEAFEKLGGICYNRSIGRKADYYG